ncbi:hypothetical protein [Neorhizobium galegae]|uniref:hypothetical protein n=1 Tax=Neorhizobium galegae TaxID=399 RepID=UPI00059CC8FD
MAACLISVSKSALPSLQTPATVALLVGPQVAGVSNIGRRTERTIVQQRHAAGDHEDMVRIMGGKVERNSLGRQAADIGMHPHLVAMVEGGSRLVGPRVADPYFSL